MLAGSRYKAEEGTEFSSGLRATKSAAKRRSKSVEFRTPASASSAQAKPQRPTIGRRMKCQDVVVLLQRLRTGRACGHAGQHVTLLKARLLVCLLHARHTLIRQRLTSGRDCDTRPATVCGDLRQALALVEAWLFIGLLHHSLVLVIVLVVSPSPRNPSSADPRVSRRPCRSRRRPRSPATGSRAC